MEHNDVIGQSLLALGRWVIGAPEILPISEERHQHLRAAMDGLWTMLGFEDKFAMLVDNLVEFRIRLTAYQHGPGRPPLPNACRFF
jgi:hypothetical protein